MRATAGFPGRAAHAGELLLVANANAWRPRVT